MSIYVSEHDEILNTKKVVKEVNRFPNVKLTHWKDVGHAAVITKKELWMDVAYDFMDEKSTACSSNSSNSGTNTGSTRSCNMIARSSSSFSMSRVCSSTSSCSMGSGKDKLE